VEGGVSAAGVLCVLLPIKIASTQNTRECWQAKARRAKVHRETASGYLWPQPKISAVGPIEITLTRIGVRRLDDDNLAGGFKACRDGVADWLGIDDGSPRLEWSYAQRKAPKGASLYGAEVVIRWDVA
jgi:hypothetical protein